MATLDIDRTYADGEILTEADLDNICDGVETFLNVTRINDDNIQNNGINAGLKLLTGSVTAAKLGTNSVTTIKIADQNVTTAKIADANVTIAKLAAEVLALTSPAGSITAYVAETAPSGWLLCDGSAVSRATYSVLFGVIGETFGQGDNSTTFNVPDFRGRFLRGWDDGAGRDPDAAGRTAMATGGNSGDNLGSVQGFATGTPVDGSFSTDSSGSHGHSFEFRGNDDTNGSLYLGPSTGSLLTGKTVGGVVVTSSVLSSGAHTHTITGGGDNETRPINAYVNYIIKT